MVWAQAEFSRSSIFKRDNKSPSMAAARGDEGSEERTGVWEPELRCVWEHREARSPWSIKYSFLKQSHFNSPALEYQISAPEVGTLEPEAHSSSLCQSSHPVLLFWCCPILKRRMGRVWKLLLILYDNQYLLTWILKTCILKKKYSYSFIKIHCWL